MSPDPPDRRQDSRPGPLAGSNVVVLRDEAAPPALLTTCHGLVVESFGTRFSDDDWDHARGGWRIVLLDDDQPIAHAAVVPRRLRVGDAEFAAGYVEAVATRVGRHGEGLGSALLTEVNEIVKSQYAFGALSTSRQTFYARLGWERWRGPSYVQDGARLIRTVNEEAGLMVLRFGPTADLDRAASITCEARPGDDW